MNSFQSLGKYLDQPVLVAKFQNSVPGFLAGTTAVYTAAKTISAPKNQKKETAVKTGMTLGAASMSALMAPRIASKITKRALTPSLETIKENNRNIVDEFLKNNNIKEDTKELLNKSKDKILNRGEINKVFEELSKNEEGKDFLEKLIPSPKNITAKDIFSEIGYLSILGAIPVVGGITGGIAADKITEKNNWKEKIPDKIKEGSYQYLANIFMCNIGAGAALGILEHAGIKSKSARAIGMTAGIITTGIIGGSKIANLLGRKVIDPVCDRVQKKHHDNNNFEDILTLKSYNHKSPKKYKERTPEVLDIGLHTDDIATVSLLSGLKWIEPALPVMYTISGYRAGIGYRN